MRHKIIFYLWVVAIIIWICAALTVSGCMRFDSVYKEYDPNGLIKTYHRVSTTSWATDSSSDRLTIDPNGHAEAINFGKQEDSVNIEVDPLQRKARVTSSPAPQ
jgi:hypothetical protein